MRIAPWILSLAYATAASAGPYSLSYGGRFADAEDKAVAGPVDIEVRFYRTASGGSQTGPTVSKTSVELVDGIFQLDLDGLSGGDLHEIVSATAATYIEIKDVTHGVTLPRQRLTAVPYAQKVPVDGKTVGYSASGELRLGVSGTPAANQFLTLDGSGNLVWGSPTSSGGSGSGPWTSADIVDGTLTNADISASAAISLSKISGLGSLASVSAVAGGAGGSITDGTITNADIASGAAISVSKISGLGSLATSSAVSGGAGGAISDGTIDNADISGTAAIETSKLAGALTAVTGHGLGALATLSTVSSAQITDDQIVDADVSASAAIADTKLATIATAGKVSGTAITSGSIGGTATFAGSGGVSTSGNITLSPAGSAATQLRFQAGDASNYVAFKAPSTVASNLVLTLPAADGTTDQFLKTDGAGNLTWGSPTGGGNMLGSANLGDLTNAATARTNLGLGTLATLNAVGATEITDASIANADISDTAAIATSKLAGALTAISGHGLGALATLSAVSATEITDGTIANADISAAAAIDASKMANGAVSSTEFQYLDGVTSSIQTQLDAKASAASPTFTGAVSSDLGSAAAPSYSFTGDSNTGVWSSAAGTVNVSTAGSERLRVTSSGSVGIGTTAPSAMLHVNTTSSTQGFVVTAAGGQTADLLAALNPSGSVIARVTAAGEFSNPNPGGGSGTGNERFGFGAGSNMTTGAGNTLIGNVAGNSVTTGSSNTLIGKSAASALATGIGNVVIGDNAGASITGNYNTVIGTGTNTQGALDGCLALGWGSTCTAGNQMVAGSTGIRVTDIYFGNGVVNSTVFGATVNATGGSGANVGGASLTLAGGKSTGSAAGGAVIFMTSPPGSPGSNLNGLVEAMRVTSTGKVGIGISSPSAMLDVNGEAKLGVLRTTGAVHSALRIIKVSNSTLSTAGGSPTDLNGNDHYVFVDVESAVNVYVRLPDASAAGMSGRTLVLRGKTSNSGGGNNINISTVGGTINGSGSLILDAGTSTTPGNSLTFVSDGANWYAF